ncbi:MAG TPA: beta-phosphoglucomutase, partial [Lachnospiraceae bacterium]|nr:beta-phosphoglucomutase [Lachnospiraceae bacterium]
SKSKPDPEVFIKAAEYLDVPCDNCLVVEDANAGIDAAKAGHMYAAGIGDAMNYKLTDYPLTSFKDLLDICK